MTGLPRDPDEDALPANLRLALDVHGDEPLYITVVDPRTGERYRAPVTRADLAAAYGDAARLDDPDDAA